MPLQADLRGSANEMPTGSLLTDEPATVVRSTRNTPGPQGEVHPLVNASAGTCSQAEKADWQSAIMGMPS
jgi:hypothetical protein